MMKMIGNLLCPNGYLTNYDFDYARSYGPERAYKQVLDRLEATMETDGYDVPQSCAEFEEKWGFEVDSTPPDDKWYY